MLTTTLRTAALALAFAAGMLPVALAGTSKAPVGMNLGGVSYWENTMPFANLMKNSGEWLSTDSSGTWDTGVISRITLDGDGYPLQLPVNVNGASTFVHAIVLGNRHPGGRHVILYAGEGDVQVSGASVIQRTPGRVEIDLGADQQLILSISRSTQGNHVRDIRLVKVENEGTYATQPLDLGFLERLKGVKVLRFMDWNQTYSTTLARWVERTPPTYYTQGTPTGVALEHQIDVANAVGADYWLNFPVTVDDDYVRQAARLVRTRLAAGLKVYIEFGNEVWNGGFSQQQSFVQNRGCDLGLNQLGSYAGSCSDGGPRYWAGLKWQARRSGDIFRIFEQEFGSASRLVRVIASQAGYTDIGAVLMRSYADASITPSQGGVDALAIAPYFSANFGNSNADRLDAAAMSVEQILDRLDVAITSETAAYTRENKATANNHHVRLIAYESGQHAVGIQGAENNNDLTIKLNAANRHVRMQGLYDKMFDAWSDNGGELLTLFTHIGAFSKWGSWGLLEYQDQPTAQAPKFAAVQALMARATGNTPAPPPVTPPPVTPPPVTPPPVTPPPVTPPPVTPPPVIPPPVTPPPVIPPKLPIAPSNLAVVVPAASQIQLQWVDASANETGFEVERSVSGGAFVRIGVQGANATSYTDSSKLSWWRSYSYRVRAINAAGASAYSNVVSARPRFSWRF